MGRTVKPITGRMTGDICRLLEERGFGGGEFQSLIVEDPDGLIVWARRKVSKGRKASRAVNAPAGLPTFSITLGDGRTAEQLYLAGGYTVFDKYDQWGKDFVLSGNFKLGQTKEDMELVYVEFDYDPTSDQVLTRFKELGLDQPEPEDAVRFGEKYPDEQMKNPVVFLHKPWRDPDGYRGVLVLHRFGSRRWLRCRWFDCRWYRRCRFVARRRKSL